MLIEIKNRWDASVIFSGEFGSIKLAVEAAVSASVSLSRADLRGAILDGADLRGAILDGAILDGASLDCASLDGANLSRANLSRANLIDANLSRANLSRANLSRADLIDANLIDANLSRANLSRANLSRANLSDADLSGANLSGAPFKIENIHQKVYEAASQPGALDMGNWHNPCGTTHCRAGWVVALAGEAGKTLEWAYGTPAAASLIYVASDPKISKMPDFYCGNDEALADMKARAEAEAVAK